MSDLPGSTSWWEWLGGLAFVAVSGLFAFTHQRISAVKTEAKADQMEEVLSLRQEVARMEGVFNLRFQEGRNDRGEQWKAIKDLERRSAEMHAQNLERLGQIPTRDEMMRMLQQFMQKPPR